MTWISPKQLNVHTAGTDYAPVTALINASDTGAKFTGVTGNPLITKDETVNTVVGTTADTEALNTGSYSLISFLKAIFTNIKNIYTWTTAKQQILEIKVLTGNITNQTIGANSSAITIYRTDSEATGVFTLQGIGSSESPYSLGIQMGVSGSVINHTDYFSGMTINMSSGATGLAILTKPYS